MNKKFYPIIVNKKGTVYTASIVELNILVQGNNHSEALDKCLIKKNEILNKLIDKKIPLPEIINSDDIKIFQFSTIRKATLFIIKSFASSIIFLITLSIILIALSPLFKNYLISDTAKNHFNKFTKKFGISTCINNTCD